MVWRRGLVLLSAVTAAVLAGPSTARALSTADLTTATYVVADYTGTGAAAAAGAVGAVGGQILVQTDAAQAVSASLTSTQAAALSQIPGVVVVPDTGIAVQDTGSTGSTRAPAAVFPQDSGATKLWAQGDTGQGVNVAVVDTGIDALPDFAGRMVAGVDFTSDHNPWQDDYGHGTFVAGLIAGNGASSQGTYKGEAPGAGLVSVKVAGANGETDLATVLAAIDWVVKNRAIDHIGVMNLSLGMVPNQSTVLNPLDQAVESAWKAGITVVASAGNAGPFNGTILSPGDDPLVITAGAYDDQGSTNPAAAVMSTFSSVGPTNPDGWIKPDLVASGRSVVSLRAPGSTVDQQFPSARIGTANFVGSGTSFSAAITSGAAALIIEQNPGGRPDDIKGRLAAGASPGPVGNPFVDGHGLLNVPGAMALGPGNSVHLTQTVPTQPTASGSTVSLQQSWAGSSWNGANYYGNFTGSSWNGSSWNGSSWNGSSWNGSSWNGFTWGNNAWNGSSWNGSSWNGSSWNGSSWNGSSWNGSAWNGSSWNGSAWNGSSWNGFVGSSWNGTSWNGTSWNGTSWNGTSWNGTSWN